MDWLIQNITIIASIVGVTGVPVAIFQLIQVNRQLKNTALTNVLSLEAEMNTRKETIDNISHEIEKLNIDGKLTDEIKVMYEKRLEAAVENWLNSVDRLCFCILKGYLKEKSWKAEYRDLITGVVDDNPTLFGENSKYTNIIDTNRQLRRT